MMRKQEPMLMGQQEKSFLRIRATLIKLSPPRHKAPPNANTLPRLFPASSRHAPEFYILFARLRLLVVVALAARFQSPIIYATPRRESDPSPKTCGTTGPRARRV